MKQSLGIISTAPDWTDGEEAELGAAECELRQLIVPSEQHGARLDRALSAAVPEFSRSYLQQIIYAGLVRLQGQTARKASQKVRAGDALSVELRPTPQSQAFQAQDMPLNVVFEDEHLLVLDKPAGLVVHPAPGNWTGTLLNGLLARNPQSVLVPRAGIVHRLDKDTSGLMVVARTRASMDALVQAIAARAVSRQYIALAHGAWVGPSRRSVTAAIGRDPRNRLRMAVVDLATQAGKPAQTDIELLGNAPGGAACFVRCVLHTGRTHQIRVHMASLGHPLLADTVYGGMVQPLLARQALHAFRLAFVHPVTGAHLVFESAPPHDIRSQLADWGLRYNLAHQQ